MEFLLKGFERTLKLKATSSLKLKFKILGKSTTTHYSSFINSNLKVLFKVNFQLLKIFFLEVQLLKIYLVKRAWLLSSVSSALDPLRSWHVFVNGHMSWLQQVQCYKTLDWSHILSKPLYCKSYSMIKTLHSMTISNKY